MDILFLAPHPFFQNRGTPIDALLVARVLSERTDTRVDMLTYPEGEHVELTDVMIHRISNLKITRGVRPGFSVKKIICDVLMLFKAWGMVRTKHYDFVHADEEAVFIALFFRWLYKIPYAYDLDSSIAQQVVEKKPFLRILSPFLTWLEAQAIKRAMINLPVCNALFDLCEKEGSQKTITLHDISQLTRPNSPQTGRLKADLGITGLVLLYIGNFEVYQGVDLLLDGFALASQQNRDIFLVLIGGVEEDIRTYQKRAEDLGIQERAFFLGPKPFSRLDEYLCEADILVAPRLRGINTPMKIFPYMHSGRAVLLTNLPTHTQLVSSEQAYLADPTAAGFAAAINRLAGDRELRERLGRNGYAFVESNHTYDAHKRRVMEAYDYVESRLGNGV
jgi:glycosyltransferase involved in cell wall biosynthesis